jgi:hypothetical protein
LPSEVSVRQGGGAFLLRHQLCFNQADSKGDFILVMYWQAPSAEENFTLENVEVYWEDGSPMENVSVDNYPIVFQGDPSKRGWRVEVDGGLELNQTL